MNTTAKDIKPKKNWKVRICKYETSYKYYIFIHTPSHATRNAQAGVE